MRPVTPHGMRPPAILPIALLFLGLLSSPARADRWITYAYPNDQKDIVAVGTNLWIATTGGVLKYDTTTGAFQQYTRRSANGPVSQDMVTVTYEPEEHLVFFGSGDKGVSVYDAAADRWQRFDELPDNRINSVSYGRGSVYVATRAGFSIRRSVRNTDICNDIDRNCCGASIVCNFPSFDVRDFEVVGDRLWAATAAGPAVHDSLGIPLERFHWQAQTALGSAEPKTASVIDARSLAALNGTLFLATPAGAGVYRWNPDSLSWSSASSGLPLSPALGSNVRLVRLPRGGDSLDEDLWLATNSGVYLWNGSSWTYTGLADISVRSVAAAVEGGTNPTLVIYAATQQGLYRYTGGTEWTSIRAPGPPLNISGQSIDVDKNGVIWIGTLGGAMSYTPDGVWASYRNGTNGIDPSEIYSIFTDSRARVWLGKCCCGGPPSCPLQFLDAGAPSDSLQAWNGWGLAEDQAGRIWVGMNGSGLEVLDPSGTPIASVNSAGGHLRSNSVRAVATQGDRVWVGHEDRGLQAINTNGHPETPTGYSWKTFTTSEIPDQAVSDIAIEGNSAWVVTSSALTRVQGDVVTERHRLDVDGEPRRGYAVDVDKSGNKWVATSGGVLRFDRGGQLTVFNTGNSDLIANEVLDVAVDPKTGDVLFETQIGTSRLTPESSPPPGNAAQLFLFPNPFRAGTGLVKVGGGLADNAMVMDLVGRQVASFNPAQGWDGLNAGGRAVAPGIYFVNVGDQVLRLAVIP